MWFNIVLYYLSLYIFAFFIVLDNSNFFFSFLDISNLPSNVRTLDYFQNLLKVLLISDCKESTVLG